jgi:hypothetical protein
MALLTIDEKELQEWKDKVHYTLHRLWSKAVGTEDYVKKEWGDFDELIKGLSVVSVPNLDKDSQHRIKEAIEQLGYLANLADKVADVVKGRWGCRMDCWK